MNDQVKREVVLRIEQFLAGAQIETNRFDLKKKWYRFNDMNGNNVSFKNEFWKDIAAMANSYGAEDGFIVFGVDEGTRTLHETRIEDAGLTQPQIKDLILSNVDRPISIDIEYVIVNGVCLSVIHVPVSINKPHLVSKYTSFSGDKSENVIFIRTGSGTHVAGRGEIDTMYWERSNIHVERRIEGSFNLRDVSFRATNVGGISLSVPLNLENMGTRVLSILSISIIVEHAQLPGSKLEFKSQLRNQSAVWYKLDPKTSETKSMPFTYKVSKEQEQELNKLIESVRSELQFKHLLIKLNNGEEIFGLLRTFFE